MKSRLFLAGWALVIIGLVGLPAAAIGAGGDAAVLYTIVRMERPSRFAAGAIILGYVFHTVYIFVEMGDGDFFTLPVERNALRWWEEISELLFLCSYLVGFVLVHLGTGAGAQGRRGTREEE